MTDRRKTIHIKLEFSNDKVTNNYINLFNIKQYNHTFYSKVVKKFWKLKALEHLQMQNHIHKHDWVNSIPLSIFIKGELKPEISLLRMKVLTLIKIKSNDRALVVNILVIHLRVQLRHGTYQRKTLLFTLIKVSTFICKRQISGFSSPLSFVKTFFH